jgi:hypothetical protein
MFAVAQIRSSCASMIERQIESPIPMPVGLDCACAYIAQISGKAAQLTAIPAKPEPRQQLSLSVRPRTCI